jgi:predicted nucleic acid-binding protein
MHRRSETLYEDAMIAAIAKVNGLAVATRNVVDFARFGVELVNPVEVGPGR